MHCPCSLGAICTEGPTSEQVVTATDEATAKANTHTTPGCRCLHHIYMQDSSQTLFMVKTSETLHRESIVAHYINIPETTEIYYFLPWPGVVSDLVYGMSSESEILGELARRTASPYFQLGGLCFCIMASTSS